MFSFLLMEQMIEQTVVLPVIWDVMSLIWRHCNECSIVICGKLEPYVVYSYYRRPLANVSKF